MMELDYLPSPELHGATVSVEKLRHREPPKWPSPARLCVLRWDNDEDDDDTKDNAVPKACSTSFFPTKEKLVGWPPVKRWRKKSKWKRCFNRTVDNACIACRGRTPYDRTVKN